MSYSSSSARAPGTDPFPVSLTIVPFTLEWLPEAGELLARHHARLREVQPQLPPTCEEPVAARRLVDAAWQREGATGVAALRADRLVGYLLGDTVLDMLWGRSAWIRLAGCALAPEEDPELVRDLYAALAAPWVRIGCFTHFALMPCADAALLDRWFALSFGIEQVHALATLGELDLSPRPLAEGVEIRRAGPEDRPRVEALSDIIWRHQVQAPVWGIHLPEREASSRRQYGDLVEDPDVTLWLALWQGQAVGLQGYFGVEGEAVKPVAPERSVELGIAGTRQEARGRGIGQALTRHGLAHARAEGYRFCLTDWRSTNLLASRFWPRQGFQPVAYRLVRRIDPRIAWAGESTAA